MSNRKRNIFGPYRRTASPLSFPVLFYKSQRWFNACLVSVRVEDRLSVIVAFPNLLNSHLVQCL
jgi:hypothetical protein